MRHVILNVTLAGILALLASIAVTQETQQNVPAGQHAGGEPGASQERWFQRNAGTTGRGNPSLSRSRAGTG